MDPFARLDPAYAHGAKTAVALPSLTLRGVELKWYQLHAEDAPVPPAIEDAARAYATEAFRCGSLRSPGDAGFVILHRCGAGFYFLLAGVWRGSNELWQAVHYKDASMAGFAPFTPAYPAAGPVRPTFCVWELGIVAHEAQAWAAYLRSPRTAQDQAVWREARFAGTV